ncbi:MAG: hypothetical protein B9S32_06700 [Verrucomicrobia bacterium Tous-C9LFEB]|nr:MAG: hypothetical protein B9S32_06700 [Verrucomicrobia bacterium Tous-C9LFEB]
MSRLSTITLGLCLALAIPGQGATYYVNVNKGGPSSDGLSPERAYATIQEAAKKVAPGDTILVAEGVYYGPIELKIAGTAEKPITIRAQNRARNAVIITNADRGIREGKTKWTLVDESLGLYKAFLERPTCRVLYSGTDLQPYANLEGLKTFTTVNGYPGPQHGYYYDAGAQLLYVRLNASGKYGSANPADHIMSAGSASGNGSAANLYNGPTFFNLGLMGTGPLHVIVDGFTFETPGYAGVFVNGDEVTVRHSWFVGCRGGVSGRKESPEATETSNHVTVEFCDYHQFPAFDDAVELIKAHGKMTEKLQFPAYWWSRKGNGATNLKTYETGICNLVGSNWIVRNNRIHDAFEGLSTWTVRWSKNMDIYANRFERLVDNAVEAEDHAANMRVHDNLILNVTEPFSWQPLGGTPWPGPVYIYRNMVRSDFAYNRLMVENANWTPGWFKAGASRENWESKWNSHMKDAPRDVVRSPGDGVVVFNNTIFFPGGNFLTYVQPPDRKLDNFWFYNNISVAQGFSRQGDFDATTIHFSHNLWAFLPASDDRGAVFAGEGGAVIAESAEALSKKMEGDAFMRGRLWADHAGTGVSQAKAVDAKAESINWVGANSGAGDWKEPVVGPQP